MHTTTITEWLPSILLLLLPLTNDNYAVVNSVACRRIYAQAVSEKKLKKIEKTSMICKQQLWVLFIHQSSVIKIRKLKWKNAMF